jgi:hypothetical protein
MTRSIEISTQTYNMGTLSGINNVADKTRLKEGELLYATNVDISDKGEPSRRNGIVKKVTPAGQVHSMWGDNKMCFYVENGVLKRLNNDYTSTVLRTDVSNYHMSFTEVNDKYFYSNPAAIGYIYNGESKIFATPTKEFRHAPQPGQIVEYFNGRLYIARNEIIWYSDVNYFGEVDRRTNFITLENEITMMKAVDDGLWITVGDINRQNTYFISGATTETQSLKRFAGYGCIEGSDVKIKDGQKVGEGLSGTVIMWTSNQGICIGANSGNFINVTDGRYNVANRRYGAGIFRDENGFSQYISTLWD